MKNADNKPSVQIGTTINTEGISIEIIPNGPYAVHGSPRLIQHFIMANQLGISVNYQEGASYPTDEKTSLCRCGLSQNKPYCDGSHVHAKKYGIDLEETATTAPSLKSAEEIDGPIVSLTDDEKLCAFARFCDNGKRIWNEVQEESERSIELSVQMAHHCPAGRLIVWDNNSKEPIENKVEPVIGIIEDLPNQLSGPLALKGGIPVKSSEGFIYEVRNRQTLCRCGMSDNKPFCNGAHASMKFQDGLPQNPKEDGNVKHW